MAKIIYVKKKDAPKDFQSWYLTEARSVVKKIKLNFINKLLFCYSKHLLLNIFIT